MIETIKIRLSDGQQLKWDFGFSVQGTLRLTHLFLDDLPDWIRLEYRKCPACTLDDEIYTTCPVAEVLSGYAYDLAERESFERVKVEIYQDDDAPIVLEEVPLQNLVSELVRLAVFQYECPIGRKVKPAMTQLPPFPNNDQIMQAFARAFAGRAPALSAKLEEEAGEIMDQLHDVFGNLCVRLESMGNGDAHVNGVVILHSLAALFALSAPELIAAVAQTATTSDATGESTTSEQAEVG